MYRFLWFVPLFYLIQACGVLFPGPSDPPTAATLKPFASEQELTDFFRAEIGARNDTFGDVDDRANGGDAEALPLADSSAEPSATGGDVDPAAAPVANDAGSIADVSDDSSAPGFSGTTTQEAGVDEADVVKTDGTYLYILDANAGDGSILRIVRISPPEQIGIVSELVLDGMGRDIYLHGDKVVALTSRSGRYFALIVAVVADLPMAGGAAGGSGFEGIPSDVVEIESVEIEDGSNVPAPEDEGEMTSEVDPVPPPPLVAPVPEVRFERPTTTVTVIDVSEVDQPRILSRTRFDGSAVTSRMIDGVLHLVISNYQRYYYDVLPMLGRPELDLADLDVAQLLPRYERTDADGTVTRGPVLTWEDLYRPAEPDGFGVVSVVSVDADRDATFRAAGIVAEPGLVYSSTSALYLTNTSYNSQGQTRSRTNIYKLTYKEGGALPVASGSVPGRILNQYSMGEYEDHLRVATTVDRVFSSSPDTTQPFNNVYVLAQAGGVLEIVGEISNITPGETIQSARFTGKRGYLVTFERIDPLITLDLSDPVNPREVGELKIPGFSTFIVPMGRDHLLTVGQYVPLDGPFFNRGVQLSIFDVSDFANPTLAHQVILGEDGMAWSEALFNPKAFTFFRDQGLVALPVSIQESLVFFEPGVSVLEAGETVDVEPVSVGESDDAVALDLAPQGFEGLVVYEVSAETGFTELGRISTRYEEAGSFAWTAFTRGVFLGENVFAVSNQGIRGAAVSDVDATPFELFYGRTTDQLPGGAGGVVIEPIEIDDDAVDTTGMGPE